MVAVGYPTTRHHSWLVVCAWVLNVFFHQFDQIPIRVIAEAHAYGTFGEFEVDGTGDELNAVVLKFFHGSR
ncbi:hypothetical protein CM1200mP19_1360 [bacterium]|nr:MAG: hypothetical protein CM1200mP19_1360 [bacterium]